MTTIKIPYLNTELELHVAKKNLRALITERSGEYISGKSEEELVRESLARPYDSARLWELAAQARRVTIVTSDHTRAVPSRITLPILLEEVRRGNPEADITILIGTGLHRPTTETEQRRMFGDTIVDNERIVVNNAFEPDDFVNLGTLPSGAEFVVNRLAVDCDLLITEGLIEPHFFAGFSGGCKSILPGVCSAETVNENHSYKAISSPLATTGVLERNPIHDDMVRAARLVNVQFICNVVLNSKKEIIGAFSGDLESAHAQGVEFIKSLSKCPRVTGDIVVTSNGGYPLDQNLYQSPKSASTAQICAGEDGVIILICSCCDGLGGERFGRILSSGTVCEIDSRLSVVPPKQTEAESWNAQIFCRILKKHRVILVSELDPKEVVKFNMIPASGPNEALTIAYGLKGEDAQVVVIPDGVAALITL